MEKSRCPWGNHHPLFVPYHDTEWGAPVFDDQVHFEFLILESAQAGLSWLTILKRREGYRAAYEGFNPERVASFNQEKIEKLLLDERIIRNRRKVEASVNNAARFMEVQREFGSFSDYIWGFVDGRPVVGGWETEAEVPASTELSDRVSKDLKKRGFKFIGTTIIYSHLQATGVVNDHIRSCFRFGELTGEK